MIGQVILEGVGLGAMLMLVCAIGIRNGAVGMVHLYENNVQERRREIHQEGGFQVYRGGDFPDCQLRHGTVLSGE